MRDFIRFIGFVKYEMMDLNIFLNVVFCVKVINWMDILVIIEWIEF